MPRKPEKESEKKPDVSTEEKPEDVITSGPTITG